MQVGQASVYETHKTVSSKALFLRHKASYLSSWFMLNNLKNKRHSSFYMCTVLRVRYLHLCSLSVKCVDTKDLRENINVVARVI